MNDRVAANVGRIRHELGISISIVSDEEVTAAAPADDNAAARFLIDSVLNDPLRIAMLSQNLAIRKTEDTEAFLRSRRAGFVAASPPLDATDEPTAQASARRSRSAGVPRGL